MLNKGKIKEEKIREKMNERERKGERERGVEWGGLGPASSLGIICVLHQDMFFQFSFEAVKTLSIYYVSTE